MVVGTSMGGAIAAAFAADFPHLVDRRVALLAPAGMLDHNDVGTKVAIISSGPFQALVRIPAIRALVVPARGKNQEAMQEVRGIMSAS